MKKFFCFIIGICITLALHARKECHYKGMLELECGAAYNFNTAQLVSTNNMQLFTTIATIHGLYLKPYFVGLGGGFYHSFRDNENIYPVFTEFRYDWGDMRFKPYIDLRLGVVYDPYWISTVQGYGGFGIGVQVYENLHFGCRGAVFSRPSRYFTANASIVIGYYF